MELPLARLSTKVVLALTSSGSGSGGGWMAA